MMQLPAPPYGQPYANAALNSHEPVACSAQAGGFRSVVTVGCEDVSDASRWLLSGGDGATIVAVSEQRLWLVDVTAQRVRYSEPVHSCAGTVFVDSENVLFRTGDVLRKLRVSEPEATAEQIYVPDLGQHGQLQAIVPAAKDFTCLVQHFGRDGKPHCYEASMSRKPYTSTYQDYLWWFCYEGEIGRSPALADGTLILCTVPALITVGPDGLQRARIDVSLIPGLVAVDLQQRIWGFERRDETIVAACFSARGERCGEVDLGGGQPVQPPVALDDGRVAVVTEGSVVALSDSGVDWRRAAPGSSGESFPDR